MLGLRWINERATAYCYILAAINGTADAGPYQLMVINPGKSPVYNVAIRLFNEQEKNIDQLIC
jgi:hypothetical protein